MKNKNFEKELPEGYALAQTVDATDKKLGLLMNLAALIIGAVVFGISLIPIIISKREVSSDNILPAYLILLIGMIAYIILHELVHGIAYKSQTGEKLTFGLKWSCAFCGVPHIFVYRKTALMAVTAPLIFFTAVFIPLTVALYFVDTLIYFAVVIISALHFGGCSGDIYVTYLLLKKYKDPATLMNDTGPKMTLYVPNKNEG